MNVLLKSTYIGCVVYFSIHFLHMLSVNGSNEEELICCCSEDQIIDFKLKKCLATLLSNKSFVQCNNVKNIEIHCTSRPQLNLQIESGAFQSLTHLNRVLFKNYNIRHLPDRVFCQVDSVDEITLMNNAIKDIYNKGFGNECDQDQSASVLTYMDFSYNEIEIVRKNTFSRLKYMELLDLSNNHLAEIEDGAFNGLSSLIFLALSNNRLAFLPENLFRDLESLIEVVLSSNQFTTQGLPNLQYLHHLENVFLDCNLVDHLTNKVTVDSTRLNISSNPIVLTDDTFLHLPNLKRLYINNANITDLPSKLFSNLFSLTNLTLSHNNIRSMEENLLKNCPITYLDLSNNNINYLSELNLRSLRNLTDLLLRNNHINIIDGLCLTVPSVNLKYLDLSFNNIERINDEFHCYYSLEVLNLSHNRVKVTASSHFIGPPRLKKLFLDYNRLTSVDSSIIYCSRCKTISMTHNNISFLSLDILNDNTQFLNISHNSIKNDFISFPPPINITSLREISIEIDISFNILTKFTLKWLLYRVKTIHVNDNFIQDIEYEYQPAIIYGIPYNIYLHNNNLTHFCLHEIAKITLTLRNNPFVCSCEMNMVYFHTDSQQSRSLADVKDIQCINPFSRLATGYQSISSLDKSRNFLCKSTYQNMKSCTCNDRITYHTQCYFQCPTPCTCYHNQDSSFAIIDCSMINITSVPVINLKDIVLDVYLDGNDITILNQFSFQYSNKFQKLYLNNSKIESIYSQAFKNFQTLQMLNLRDNRIQTIPPELFQPLVYLQQLDLANNTISNLSLETLLPLTNIKILNLNHNLLNEFSFWNLNLSGETKLIAIHGNPWSCECYFVTKLIKWLTEYPQLIDNKDAVSCREENGLKRYIAYDQFPNCYSNDANVQETTSIWASVVAVICFLSLISFLIFYYRREMQVLIYSRYRIRLFYKQNDEADDKLFDVFVAYSGEDEEFVVNNLLPGLENIEKPYKTCVHNRDFVAGGFITENIMEAVEISRRTLIVLTEHFVKSEWCRFEFKAAHSQMLRDQRNRVIVVVINELPKSVDKELQLYLKTKTYLKWDDRLFWQRLYFVLPDKQQIITE